MLEYQLSGYLQTLKTISLFLDFKKKLKIDLSGSGKMYSASALLHNARKRDYFQ